MNFCHHLLVEKVTCSQVCCDGYDVTNLTSSYSNLKARGFLAARFVKPPVEIKFQLIAPIDIQFICINRKVGSQVSSGFEIYVGKEIDQMRWAGKAVVQETSSNQVDKMVIIFTNEAFSNAKEWQDVTDDNLKCHHSNYFYLRGRYAVLSDVQYITIKIFKTSHSSLAAVKFIQIWGKPSRNCNKNILKRLKEIKHEITTQSEMVHDTSLFHTDEVDYKNSNRGDKSHCNNELNTKTKTQIENTIQSVNSYNEELIPNDFLDSITCEMMQLPMLLPSGQNIDRTTLDRWIKDLSTRGKDPCDPFTGIAFTETNRPIFNTALKIRLDKYIVDFGNLPSIGRTVGTNPCDSQELNIFRTVKSVVANMNTSRHIDNAKVTTTAKVNVEISKCAHSSKDQIKPNNPILETIGTKRKFKNYTITSKINMKKTGSTNQDGSTDNSAKSDGVSSDLQKIRRSLKQAFNSKQPPAVQIQDTDIKNKITLCKSKMVRTVGSSITQHIGTYDEKVCQSEKLLKSVSTIHEPSLICICTKCCVSVATLESIFQLKCNHLLCRSCLMETLRESDSEIACNQCGIKSLRAVITRVHQSSFRNSNF